jgi:hypothetical protein
MLFFFFTAPPIEPREFGISYFNPASISPQGKDLTAGDSQPAKNGANILVNLPAKGFESGKVRFFYQTRGNFASPAFDARIDNPRASAIFYSSDPFMPRRKK